MLIAERLRRLLLLAALLLILTAGALSLVNVPAAVALVALACLGIGLAFVTQTRPARPQRLHPTETDPPDSDSQAFPAAAEGADEETGPAQPEDAEERDAPASGAIHTTDLTTPTTIARRPAGAWLWLIGALSLGIVIGALANRALPVPQFTNVSVPGKASAVELASPLVSPIHRSKALSSLIESRAVVNDEEWTILHSTLDIGQIGDIFDGRPETLIRGESANPFILEVRYPQPRPADVIVLHLDRVSNFAITITAVTADGDTITFGEAYTEEPPDPVLEFEVTGGRRLLRSVRMEILDHRPRPQEGFHTVVRELELR